MEISYKEEIKRKLVHLSSLWMVAATLLLPRWGSCLLFFLLLVLTLLAEHDYANGGPWYLGRLYGKIFGKMLRNEVKPGQWIVSLPAIRFFLCSCQDGISGGSAVICTRR